MYKSKFVVKGMGAVTLRSLDHINNSSQISRSEHAELLNLSAVKSARNEQPSITAALRIETSINAIKREWFTVNKGTKINIRLLLKTGSLGVKFVSFYINHVLCMYSNAFFSYFIFTL
jgi:hypothetical protein